MATGTKAPPKQAAPPPPAAPAKRSSSTWPPSDTTTPAEPPASAADITDTSSTKPKEAAAGRGPGSGLDPATSRSLLIILHGKRVEDDLVREAISSLKAEGHQISVRVTFDRGDVDAFVAEAIRLKESGTSNFDTIVAGGGDGTFNEVVCAMMAHREAVHRLGLAVALLPLGTANDFACTAGISVDPLAALKTALDPSLIRPIDVAAVNGKYFANIAVAGSIAEVSPEELASKWKRLLGPVAIGFHVLKRVVTPGSLEPHKQTAITFCTQAAGTEGAAPPPAAAASPASAATAPRGAGQQNDAGRAQAPPGVAGTAGQLQAPPLVDDDSSSSSRRSTPDAPADGNGSSDKGSSGSAGSGIKRLTADMLMLAVGNSRQMGRRVKVCPDALLDDGLLDFTLWTGASVTNEATALLSALMGTGSGRSSVDRGIAQLRASWLLLEAPPGGSSLPVNRDGEPEEASSRLLFEVLPRVLPMHLPDARMLVEGRQQLKQAVQPHMSPQQQHTLLEQQHSSESAMSSSSITGNVYTEGEVKSAAAEAAARAAPHGGSNGVDKERGGRRHRKLRKHTLQRMMFDITQPEGWEVRQRQKMVALTRKLCSWGALLLLGGAAGWAYRARQERQQQREARQRKRQQQQQQEAARKASSGARRRLRGIRALFS